MILIENEIVFVSVPKCASISVHLALENSDLKIEPTFVDTGNTNFPDDYRMPNVIGWNPSWKKIKSHVHLSIAEIYSFLHSNVDTIVIKRDYCKRFISSFYYLFGHWIKENYGLVYNKNQITNDFIYEYFTDDVINCIKSMIQNSKNFEFDKKMKKEILIPLINNYCINYNKTSIIEKLVNDKTYINWRVFDSQEAWKSGHIPTYEFDINELYKLENLIESKFQKSIKIEKENTTKYSYSQMYVVEDQKLRDWVWNKFEKEYFTKKIF
jgi:hypothetical protein